MKSEPRGPRTTRAPRAERPSNRLSSAARRWPGCGLTAAQGWPCAATANGSMVPAADRVVAVVTQHVMLAVLDGPEAERNPGIQRVAWVGDWSRPLGRTNLS